MCRAAMGSPSNKPTPGTSSVWQLTICNASAIASMTANGAKALNNPAYTPEHSARQVRRNERPEGVGCRTLRDQLRLRGQRELLVIDHNGQSCASGTTASPLACKAYSRACMVISRQRFIPPASHLATHWIELTIVVKFEQNPGLFHMQATAARLGCSRTAAV